MKVVGDIITPSLGVEPFDTDTVAALRVADPEGGSGVWDVASLDGGNTWTGAELALTSPGEWHLLWTVTGTGTGEADQLVQVRAAPSYSPPGFSYATTGDLARYTGEDLPEDAMRKLIAASREVSGLTRCARYETTVAGLAVHEPTRRALADATCELLAWWELTGSQTGERGLYQAASIGGGGVSLSGFASGAAPGGVNAGRIGPQVITILADAGLLGRGPVQDG